VLRKLPDVPLSGSWPLILTCVTVGVGWYLGHGPKRDWEAQYAIRHRQRAPLSLWLSTSDSDPAVEQFRRDYVRWQLITMALIACTFIACLLGVATR
jgi:hypothetical protein